MASTNKTPNYNLSQYVGTDKPTYLGDYNSDMSKIDAQMKTNSEATSVVAGQVETVSSTATTALQNANTAQSAADSASSTANNALEKATTNEASIVEINENLETYNTYSAEETFTGEYWLDGRKIYRKCAYLSNFNNTRVETNLNITNMKNMIKYEGYLTRSDIPNRQYDIHNSHMSEVYYDTSRNVLSYSTNTQYVTFLGYIIIYYTKISE